MMKIGGHVSAAGGLDKAVDRGVEIGAEALQIFGAPPQSWRRATLAPELAALFRKKAQEKGVQPVFIHGVYLINLATANPENLKKSIASLTAEMVLQGHIGAAGVIFHLGSHKGAGLDNVIAQIVDSIRKVLDGSPTPTMLLIENSAGMGDSIGSRFADIGRIIREVGSDRVQVCLDTQHAFASGYYNVAERDGLERTLEDFEKHISLKRLRAVHANDSKCPFGGGLDRHENIGEGHIGLKGFKVIMGHTAFKDVPFLLEVPGFEGQGPDRRNVEILKELRGRQA
ncbi:MAG: deoxyribonuclease IV [Dehalococcoidia bacterium]|nr:deoxyribonuclease IV [Dehalococcoidia bacterium]